MFDSMSVVISGASVITQVHFGNILIYFLNIKINDSSEFKTAHMHIVTVIVHCNCHYWTQKEDHSIVAASNNGTLYVLYVLVSLALPDGCWGDYS